MDRTITRPLFAPDVGTFCVVDLGDSVPKTDQVEVRSGSPCRAASASTSASTSTMSTSAAPAAAAALPARPNPAPTSVQSH